MQIYDPDMILAWKVLDNNTQEQFIWCMLILLVELFDAPDDPKSLS